MATEKFVPRRVPPKPPTIEEMQTRLPGLMLYNPSDEWVPMEVHGITIYATPDLGGRVEPHPTSGEPVKCDGITDIKGRFFSQKDSSGKRIEGQDAYSRMTYLIHKERYGEMGICWIPGQDPAEDAQFKAFAKEQWLKYQIEVDDRIIDRRREFVANWKRNPAKQGVKVPPPSAKENAAIERSELRERVRTYEFECTVPECLGYATNEWAKFAGHMKAAHNITAMRRDDGYTLTDPEGKKLTVTAVEGLSAKKRTLTDDELQAEAEAEAKIEEKTTAIEAAAELVQRERGAPRRRARA